MQQPKPLSVLAALAFALPLAGQFQPNGRVRLQVEGHGGGQASPAMAVRGPCQPFRVAVDVAPDLRGRPMVLLVAAGEPVPMGHGALATVGGQFLNLPWQEVVALPMATAGSMAARWNLPGDGIVATQALVLDPRAADGFVLSGPGALVSASESVVVTRPDVIGGARGQLVQSDREGRTSILSATGDTPLGVAFDGLGRTFYGRELSTSPYRIGVVERAADGSERSLGVVVDATAGAFTFGSNGFDLLWIGGRLAFTHPQILGANHQVRTPGSIRTLDPDTGALTVLTTVAGNPSGLAQSASGDIYYGVLEDAPRRLVVRKVAPDGTDQFVVEAVPSASVHSIVGAWGFDVAVDGTRVVFNLPTRFDGAGRVFQGSIDAFDTATGVRTTLISGLSHPSGLSFDGAGALYFADVTFGPLRARLHRFAPGATRPDDLGLVLDSAGGHVALGMWGIDVVVPCR
jgi:hypothetical protein